MQLHCSACEFEHSPDRLFNLCPRCSAPLLARYPPASRGGVEGSRPDMWRYRFMLPEVEPREIVTLGEGMTPLLPARRLGIPRLMIKDESKNPTRSFKARGMAVAVTMARKLGATSLAAPTAGNAGCALAAYGARAGLPVFVAMPLDTPASIVEECRGYGAVVDLVPGVITDAGRRVQQHLAEQGGFDLSTLKEPYRVEGKKTMAYELVEALGDLPDVILYPTGGGTGLIGMWKAFEEMERLGWIGAKRPRMFAIQAAGCAPVVRAFHQGLDTAPEWENPQTSAWGLRVPRAVGDRLMLRALRESDGGAIAVEEGALHAAAAELRQAEGIDCGPEGGAALTGLRALIARGEVSDEETVVLFNTGGDKYR
jgi:threonine synthase